MRIAPGFALGSNVQLALRTLREHKVRSALAVLGVVIGVAAVIVVASILVGLDADMRTYLDNFGPNTIFVYKFDPGIHTGRLTAEERARKPLTLEDGLALAEQCPAVKRITVGVYPRGNSGPSISSARYRNREVFGIDYHGALPSYEQVYTVELSRGRFYTEAEDEHRRDVAVIGYDLADAFFPGVDPLGKAVLVSGVEYEVVGVLEKRKGQLMRDNSADKMVLVPYHTYRKHNPFADDHLISAQAYPNQESAAEEQIRGVLRIRRRVDPKAPDNFGISSAAQISDQFRQITKSIALLTIAVSSIGLLVGGVGVMNIMLMSVTERTREIGVRKAIGAKRGDIIRQFLAETIVLTGGGGLIGMLIGMGLSALINLMLPGLPSAVPLWAVVAGIGVSIMVGLFSGMYPAVKAAMLDPVEALRYE